MQSLTSPLHFGMSTWHSFNSPSIAPNAHSSWRQLKHDIALDKTESTSEQRFTTTYTNIIAHFLKPYIHTYIIHSFTLCGANAQNQSDLQSDSFFTALCSTPPPSCSPQTAQQPSCLLEELRSNWERQNIRTRYCNLSFTGKTSRKDSESGMPMKTHLSCLKFFGCTYRVTGNFMLQLLSETSNTTMTVSYNPRFPIEAT